MAETLAKVLESPALSRFALRVPPVPLVPPFRILLNHGSAGAGPPDLFTMKSVNVLVFFDQVALGGFPLFNAVKAGLARYSKNF